MRITRPRAAMTFEVRRNMSTNSSSSSSNYSSSTQPLRLTIPATRRSRPLRRDRMVVVLEWDAAGR